MAKKKIKRPQPFVSKRNINKKLNENIELRRQTYNEKRRIDRAFDRAETKKEADRLRKERRQVEKRLDKVRRDVKDTRAFAKAFVGMKAEKDALKYELQKAKRKGDLTAIKKAENKLINLETKLQRRFEDFGIVPPKFEKPPNKTAEETEDIFSKTGYQIVDNGLTIWQAMAKLNERVLHNDSDYKWVILPNGEKFKGNDLTMIAVSATNFWRIEREAGGTPRFDFYEKAKPKTLKIERSF